MLQLVSQSQLVMARARAKIAIFQKSILTLFCMVGLLTANSVFAQTITMPEVDITGIDEDSDGSEILIVIFKFIARIAIWIVMGIAGLVALKTILKSWNEQKNNDQGKWGAVVGDSLGSLIMVILVIAVGTWVLTFIA
jgi:hypothetical protein